MKKSREQHCISDWDSETNQIFCITHQTIICATCRVPIEENQTLCNNCKDETTNTRPYAESN